MSTPKPVVLHLGDDIEFNPDIYKHLTESFTVIQPSLADRQRDAWLRNLRDRKWGDFQAVFRPFWNSGLEMGRWDAEMIPLLPASLKIFASAGAGYDWADVDLLADAGVLYCNGASASSEAVADMAIYHIISVFRNLQFSNMAARSGDPAAFLDAHRNQPTGARNPAGHVLGIVGLGNIGFRVATKARACFGMRILYNDPVPRAAEDEASLGGAVRVLELDDLLAQVDCVVIAAPGTGGLRLIDAGRIACMKKGARLVNVARGCLVDEEALADALEAGHLHAVGLDVFEDEPNVNPRLAKHPRATLTSHNGGGAFETTSGFEALAMQNVQAVLEGRPALTPVNHHSMRT